MKVVMDADCLIKLTKAGAKETILKNISVFITPEVKKEVIDRGSEKNFPDAVILKDNLNKGLLKIRKPKEKVTIFKGGEAEVFSLFMEGIYDAIGSDDSKFLAKLEALNIHYMTPSACLTFCYLKRAISQSEAFRLIENLKPYISDEEYTITKLYLERSSK